eukprot:jgi/Astpho2/5480/Aster-07819
MSTGSLLHPQHSKATPSLRGSPGLSSWNRPGLSQQGKASQMSAVGPSTPTTSWPHLDHLLYSNICSQLPEPAVLILYSYEAHHL